MYIMAIRGDLGTPIVRPERSNSWAFQLHSLGVDTNVCV